METDPLSTVTAEIFIEDSTFTIGDLDAPDHPLYTGDMPTPDATGLLAAGSDAVQATCGVNVGTVQVTVETWASAPAAGLDAWADVAEVSVNWPSPTVQLLGAATDDAVAVPIPLPEAAGRNYRVRDHVVNRDAGEDRPADAPTERHLIQIWAAPSAPDALLKATDAIGAMWRETTD